jgi:hypothetical protein
MTVSRSTTVFKRLIFNTSDENGEEDGKDEDGQYWVEIWCFWSLACGEGVLTIGLENNRIAMAKKTHIDGNPTTSSSMISLLWTYYLYSPL